MNVEVASQACPGQELEPLLFCGTQCLRSRFTNGLEFGIIDHEPRLRNVPGESECRVGRRGEESKRHAPTVWDFLVRDRLSSPPHMRRPAMRARHVRGFHDVFIARLLRVISLEREALLLCQAIRWNHAGRWGGGVKLSVNLLFQR